MGIEEVNLDFAIKSYKRFLANKIIDSKGCFIPNKKPRDDGYVRFSVTCKHTPRCVPHASLIPLE